MHVPEVLAVSEDKTIYLQNDLGDVSLLNVLEEKGYGEEAYNLFRESLHQLARVQVLGDDGLTMTDVLPIKNLADRRLWLICFILNIIF